MHKLFLCAIVILVSTSLWGQSAPKNGFLNFNEFKLNQPSLSIEFELQKRTDKDLFMTGGIANYRLKKVKPTNESNAVEKNIWGVIVDDQVYINAYPYSKIKGYNLILEKGYYSYFIGEPARARQQQVELGMIKPDDKQIMVCCQTGYVILPDGSIKLLRPDLLLELCSDHPEISNEIKKANLIQEDVFEMFAILKKYNASK